VSGQDKTMAETHRLRIAQGNVGSRTPLDMLRAENTRLRNVVAERTAALEALTVLLRTSRRISSSIDYDEVLADVARSAGEVLDSPQCIVWEYQTDLQRAVFRCLWERSPAPGLAAGLVGTSYDITTHAGGLECLCSARVVQQSRSDADLPEADRRDMDAWGEMTWLTVPLVASSELLGVMILIETERERDFTNEERRLAAAVGEQAAAALANARRHRRQVERTRWLQALVEAARAVTSTLALDDLLPTVARLAADSVGSPVAFIYEYDAERGLLVTRSRFGPTNAARLDPEGTAFKVDEVPDDRYALESGEVFVETLADPGVHRLVRNVMEKWGEKTLVNVPFRFQGQALGMLVLIETEQERVFTDDELSFLQAFGKQVAIAFNNARLYATIEALATVDGLTELANHRTFYERLEQEIARARRDGAPLSLLMIDIDDFKVLNDTWGHQAGDAVLRALARLLAGQLRQNIDVPARYGGEEFAVILPSTSLLEDAGSDVTGAPHAGVATHDHREGAAALAERLRAIVGAAEFHAGDSGGTARLTVSIGVATYPDAGREMDELVAAADAALYVAKRGGKDRVSVYSR
jgi:GGDEF domain-containing protein